jgi:hypothetical protein
MRDYDKNVNGLLSGKPFVVLDDVCHELLAHLAVVLRRVVLGDEIGFVGVSFAPVSVKLTLLRAVSDPVETHVHGLCRAGLDRAVGEVARGGVVRL